MGQLINLIGKNIKDSHGTPLDSIYLNVCKPLGALRFSQANIYRSKSDRDAGFESLYIKILQPLYVDINSSNYASGTIPSIGYAQVREQLKALISGLLDSDITDDV